MKSSEKQKILASNRKALARFEILESMEAGIVLTGPETKSAKAGQVSLAESFALVKNDEVWLMNCHIAPYAYDSLGQSLAKPTRTRKLLLHKKEISRFMGKTAAKGLSLIPLELYVNVQGRVKMTLALGRGKKAPDRREDIKKKDLQRELGHKYKFR